MNRFRPLLVSLCLGIALPVTGLATPTDFIVETAAGVNPAAIAHDYAIILKDQAPGGAPFALFTADSSLLDNLENELQKDPRIKFAEIEESVGLAESDTESRGGSIPVIGSVDHLDNENANLLNQIHWSSALRTATLTPIRVAVLDTGVSPYAASLWPRTLRYQNQILPIKTAKVPYDFPNMRYPLTALQNQSVGHGTMVAGLIGEVAPNAMFIFERVADGSGNATSWSVIRGLADAVTSHAQIINISLGSPTPVVAFEQAFQWANSQGVIIVAPAGNNNANHLLEPASLDNVVPVAGVDANDLKASFSNWSSSVYACAPAVGVRSVNWDGKMAIWSGTSFSTPLVAAGICLGLGKGLPITNQNVDEYLQSGGDNINALNPLYAGKLGWRLDIAKLLTVNLSNSLRKP